MNLAKNNPLYITLFNQLLQDEYFLTDSFFKIVIKLKTLNQNNLQPNYT